MAVTEEHVFVTLTSVIVPQVFGIIGASITVPRPISVDDLVGRFPGNFAGLYRSRLGGPFCRLRISGAVADAKAINRPLDEVTVAPCFIAITCFRSKSIPFVGR